MVILATQRKPTQATDFKRPVPLRPWPCRLYSLASGSWARRRKSESRNAQPDTPRIAGAGAPYTGSPAPHFRTAHIRRVHAASPGQALLQLGTLGFGPSGKCRPQQSMLPTRTGKLPLPAGSHQNGRPERREEHIIRKTGTMRQPRPSSCLLLTTLASIPLAESSRPTWVPEVTSDLPTIAVSQIQLQMTKVTFPRLRKRRWLTSVTCREFPRDSNMLSIWP